MPGACNHKIYFETRLEIRPDLALVETFQDGSQLVRKHGFMIIIESSATNLPGTKLIASTKAFSIN